MNTDASDYGGSGKGNGGLVEAVAGKDGAVHATMLLPPLATVMLELVLD
jgi:1,4-alpha-glucan branching enzyme